VIGDILTIIWKEWRELVFQRGSWRGIFFSLLPSIILFGIIFPAQLGRLWVTSPLPLGLWAWLPTLPVMAIVADAFAGERERHTLETLLASPLSAAAILFGKVAAVVIYACALTLIVLVVALVTVNFVVGTGVILYPGAIALSGIILSLLTATLAASIGVIVSLRAPTVKQAAQQLAFVSMGLFWLPVFGFSLLPNRLQSSVVQLVTNANGTQIFIMSAITLAVIDMILLLVAKKRFVRSRLILD